jgi:hypothetical protein
VERIDQQSTVFAAGGVDDARALRQVLRIGPRHEFEARVDVVARREIAQGREAFGQSHFVRIVAGDEQVASAETGRRRDRRFVIGDARFRLQTKDLDVKHLDAGVRQSSLDLARERRVADEVVLRFGRRGCNQPDADVAEAGLGRTSPCRAASVRAP